MHKAVQPFCFSHGLRIFFLLPSPQTMLYEHDSGSVKNVLIISPIFNKSLFTPEYISPSSMKCSCLLQELQLGTKYGCIYIYMDIVAQA